MSETSKTIGGGGGGGSDNIVVESKGTASATVLPQPPPLPFDQSVSQGENDKKTLYDLCYTYPETELSPICLIFTHDPHIDMRSFYTVLFEHMGFLFRTIPMACCIVDHMASIRNLRDMLLPDTKEYKTLKWIESMVRGRNSDYKMDNFKYRTFQHRTSAKNRKDTTFRALFVVDAHDDYKFVKSFPDEFIHIHLSQAESIRRANLLAANIGLDDEGEIRDHLTITPLAHYRSPYLSYTLTKTNMDHVCSQIFNVVFSEIDTRDNEKR